MGDLYFPNYTFLCSSKFLQRAWDTFNMGRDKGKICFEQRKLNNML